MDPYAEVRWPSYILMCFGACIDENELDAQLANDLLQRIRSFVGLEMLKAPQLGDFNDQRLSADGYRFAYWTSERDFVGNPVPSPGGQYTFADTGEAVGPGFASMDGLSFSSTSPGFETCSLVWSQAFVFPGRRDVIADQNDIRRRVQQIKWHQNSYDELRDAKRHLERPDVKAAVRSAASSVDATLRYYCKQWGVHFPKKPVPFDQKIEHVLGQATRPSYCTACPDGSKTLLHLYRSRNSMHEGDCYFRDDTTGQNVDCTLVHAKAFFGAAREFSFWLDSQA